MGLVLPGDRRAVITRPAVVTVARTRGANTGAGENHYFDSDRVQITIPVSASTWSTSQTMDPGTLNTLFCPIVGNDVQNREGRKVFLKKLRIVGQVILLAQSGQTVADEAINARVVLVQDKQTNATQMTGDLCFLQGAASEAISMSMSTVNFGRFKVWKDKNFSFTAPTYSGATTAFVAMGTTRNFKWSVKVNQWVNFNATNGGTIADIVDNSFHILALSQNVTAPVQLVYKCRGVFTA